MAGRRIDGFGVARRGAIAAAIVRRTEMRAALEHLARNADVRLAGIEASAFRATAWVQRDAAGLRRIAMVLLRPPVGGPFPDIADHVVEAVAVRRKRRHG